ncbi:MAG TPA: septal ring lytic transglycosylase RlpA family protein [Flavobacteriaceae bacterium]|nr:septal ring lytic transglycosylase RlpA family protein [Flavobacteriaceae bacterium]
MPLKFSIFLFLMAFNTVMSQEKVQTGKASFYHDMFEGRLTASGDIFSQAKPTAAHKTLPFGTVVKVTNLVNGKSVIVTVNDRGPFVPGRIIDLSKSAAKSLDFINMGVVNVTVEVVAAQGTGPHDISKENNAPTMAKNPEFWELKTTPLSPTGFGVQMASFANSGNLIHLVNKLQLDYRKKVMVQIKNIQGVNIYSVLIGLFDIREKAEKFQQKISAKYPESFVVDFSKL